MRSFLRYSAVLAAVVGLAGCGGSTIDEGMPEKIDMTKDYAPTVDMPGMSPKAQKAAKAASKKAPTDAPAPPADEPK